MDAHSLARRGIGLRVDAPAFQRLARAMALTWLAISAGCALVVAARRAGGTLVEPLSSETLAGAGAALALATALARRAISPGVIAPLQKRIVHLAPTAVLILAVGALSLGGSDLLGIAVLWGFAGLEEFFSLRPWSQRGAAAAIDAVHGRSGDILRVEPLPEEPVASIIDERSSTALEIADEPSAFDLPLEGEPLESAILQQLVRRQLAAGGESIEGLLRAPVARGQRYATAHVAFCPPLPRVSECFAEPSDGPAATVKVAQALPYGVRFEIKLDRPAERADSVVVEFSILSAAPADAL